VPEGSPYLSSPRSTHCPGSLKATYSAPACGARGSSLLAFTSFYYLSFVAMTPDQCSQWDLAAEVSLGGQLEFRIAHI